MIDVIKLENYRCFEKTKIRVKELAVFVGKNNAGKSSLVEALRLVALAIRKSTKTVYKEVPKEFGLGLRARGYKLDVDKLKIDLRGIVYLYEDKIAKIMVSLDSGINIHIYLTSDYAYACLFDSQNHNITSKNNPKLAEIEQVDILPQLGLIKENEKKLTRETVEGDKDSYLFSRHFRNEILLYKDMFWKEFVKLSESTWNELKIKDIEYNFYEDDNIKLYISDSKFLAELGLMGSGLQMWLQIMWFLVRSQDATTIILDEPDVYMHPDLQRKLIRLIKKRYPQVIIATHSVEIIGEVEPGNIITIDKKKRQMSYANDMKAVQEIVDNIGAINNLSLTRIGNMRKCVFVEGGDLKILAKFADILYPDYTESLNNLPSISLGGFNNLKEAFGASRLFYEETKDSIKCIAILDSDYFPDEMLAEQAEAAKNNKLNLHIWKRKEIENYLLEPPVLYRLINGKEAYGEFLNKLEALADKYKDDVFDQYAAQLIRYDKSLNTSTANKKAREFIRQNWNSLESKLSLVSGKKMLKEINQWMNKEYKIKCTMNILFREFTKEDVCDEMKEIINQLIEEEN